MTIGTAARDARPVRARDVERAVAVVVRERHERAGRERRPEQLQVGGRPRLRQHVLHDRRRFGRVSPPSEDERLVGEPELERLQSTGLFARRRPPRRRSRAARPSGPDRRASTSTRTSTTRASLAARATRRTPASRGAARAPPRRRPTSTWRRRGSDGRSPPRGPAHALRRSIDSRRSSSPPRSPSSVRATPRYCSARATSSSRPNSVAIAIAASELATHSAALPAIMSSPALRAR